MLKRHEIQVLRRAEHTWSEIAALNGVSEKTARRIAAEGPVTSVDNVAERARREVGRPSKPEAYRDVLVQALTEDPLPSVELLHRARQAGYDGGKSAACARADAAEPYRHAARALRGIAREVFAAGFRRGVGHVSGRPRGEGTLLCLAA